MQRNYHKAPMIFQMEASECGAASMAMIFSYWGKYIPLEQMRLETGVSRDGCSAGNMMRAAKRLGMECHGYHKEPENLYTLEMPCIIHWNFNHFVVLEGFRGRFACLNDPAFGRRKVTLHELDECFTGVVLTFHPTERFVKTPPKNTFLPMIHQRLKGLETAAIQMLLLGILLILPGLILPVMSQLFLDEILGSVHVSWFARFLAFLSMTILFEAALSFYRSTLLIRVRNKLLILSSKDFLIHLFRLPMNFYEQRYAADLSGRVENNDNVNEFLAGSLAETVLNLFAAAFYLVLLIIYSPFMTAIGLIGMAANLFLIQFTSSHISNMALKLQQDRGKLAGALYAGLSIMSTIKASGVENSYSCRILGYDAKASSQEQIINRFQTVLNSIPSVIQNGVSVALLITGSVFVIHGRMTLGMLSAFTSLFHSFSEPVGQLAGFVRQIQTVKADMERVDDIMRCPPENLSSGESTHTEREQKESSVSEKHGKHPATSESAARIHRQDLSPLRGNDGVKNGSIQGDTEWANEKRIKLSGQIDCDNITFGYSSLASPLLSGISFSVTPGSSIGFVGFSGCGKSTVSKLLAGLYHPWSGSIRFDGIPLEQISPDVFHASISTVSQNITLFSGTIRENLTLWNPAILEQDVINAAKDACIHEAITQKPGAYDFHLEEDGRNLSGGQRQRLEIARALATNPTILIMDEATSALDPIVEKQIISNIKRRGCTCIIVAHRLSAIRNSDEIFVMRRGEIVEHGCHSDLVRQDGHYLEFMRSN